MCNQKATWLALPGRRRPSIFPNNFNQCCTTDGAGYRVTITRQVRQDRTQLLVLILTYSLIPMIDPAEISQGINILSGRAVTKRQRLSTLFQSTRLTVF